LRELLIPRDGPRLPLIKLALSAFHSAAYRYAVLRRFRRAGMLA